MLLSDLPINPTLRVLSLGAGVQSTVMALMSEDGIIKDKPDCGIFADTQYEPPEVYEHLKWLTNQLSFPVHIVTEGSIKDDTLNGLNSTGQRFAAIPFHLSNGGIGRRQCTAEYKLKPIKRKVRELLNVKKGERVPKGLMVEQWIGISWDEMQRAKESRDKWSFNRFPLLELEYNRSYLIDWFKDRFPNKRLTKSACIVCPYHNNSSWRDMKINEPDNFKEAVSFDAQLRLKTEKSLSLKKYNNDMYLHRSCLPLDEVDFSNAEDKGQLNFLDECEGMCGV
jgi:hypothetical protein